MATLLSVIRTPLSLLVLTVFLASCQLTPKTTRWDVPYTLQTFPPDYAERVLEIADTNRDGSVSLVEWTTAGGDARSFRVADADKDGRVTRTELVQVGSNVRVFDFVRREADFNKDNRLTPREFRSVGGVRVLRIETW